MKAFVDLFTFFTAIATAVAFFSGLYTFFTTTETRDRHHTHLESGFILLAQAQYIELLRHILGKVEQILSALYGPNLTAGTMKSYLTLRAWQASLTIALIYSCITPWLILTGTLVYQIIFSENDTVTNKLGVIFFLCIILPASSIAIAKAISRRPRAGSKYRMKKGTTWLEAERQSQLFRTVPLFSWAIISYFTPGDLMHDIGFILGFAAIFSTFIYLGLANVWAFGPKGLLFFFQMVLVLFSRVAFFSFSLSLCISILSNFGMDFDGKLSLIEILTLLLLAVPLTFRLTSNRMMLIRTAFSLLGLTLLLAYDLENQFAVSMTEYFIWSIIGFVLITGFILANSLVDLFSVSASRHFFRQARNSLNVARFSKYLLLDLGIAIICMALAAVVFFSSVLIGISLHSLYMFILPTEMISMTASQNPRMLLHLGEASMQAITLPYNGIYCSIPSLQDKGFQDCFTYSPPPKNHFFFHQHDNNADSVRALSWLLGAFFATTALPTLLNAAFMVFALFIKILTPILTVPFLRAHAILQTNRRVDLFVGSFLALSTLMCFLISYG